MHFLELEKVKKLNQRPKDALEAWLMYLNNLEGEELEAIAMENPAIRKALPWRKLFDAASGSAGSTNCGKKQCGTNLSCWKEPGRKERHSK